MQKVKGHSLRYRFRGGIGWNGGCECGEEFFAPTKAEMVVKHIEHKRVELARESLLRGFKANAATGPDPVAQDADAAAG